LLGILFALFLGNRPFASPDEGRYVEIPREMVATQDYVTPRLNGVKYFEKPPFFYWFQAANIHLFGIYEWSMRLSSVAFALIGCLGTFAFGRRFFSKEAGIAAALILATSPLYYALSRLIILDMTMTTLVTISLFCFLWTVHTPAGYQRRLWAWGFYAFSALAVLTKGIMAPGISGPVILIWALGTGRWKDLWPAYIPSGALIFFAIAAPWHILASLENPEFAYKYFIVEHFLRYTTSVHLRTKPFYFFIPVILLGLFPWVSLLWGAIQDALKAPKTSEQRGVIYFLLIWAVFTFGFFSISNSKLVPYILPCFPPLAIILGAYWVKLYRSDYSPATTKTIHLFAATLALFSLGGITTLWAMPQLLDHKPHLVNHFLLMGGAFLVLALAALVSSHLKRYKVALSTIPLSAIILVFSVIFMMPELQRPSVKPLAQIIQTLKKPGDIVGSYKTYYQDLPVYVNQTVTVIDIKGELEFGCDVEDCSQWMLNEAQYMSLWTGDKRLFIIARAAEIKDLVGRVPSFQYHLLDQDNGNILITNKT
jgi:4-amino-4-deoxy-L-arabinose transferase-like glycosyltransferase